MGDLLVRFLMHVEAIETEIGRSLVQSSHVTLDSSGS